MRLRLLPLLLLAFIGCSLLPGEQREPLPAVPLSLDFQSDSFGIVFVNGVGVNASEERYQQAVAAGARWTRWPIYWYSVESSRGRLGDDAYADVDEVVEQDLAHGLRINAVLLGTPHWAGTAGSRDVPFPHIEHKRLLPDRGGLAPLGVPIETSPPANLYASVFLPGGAINPENHWGYFVYNTVSRYRGKVAAWEMWNEPDLTDAEDRGIFWGGSAEDYYRLLKVGYLAAKAADPDALVLFAGLAFWTDQAFLPHILDLMAADPTASRNGYYFDALPLHLYSNPEHLFRIPLLAKNEMGRRGIARPIWVNEANLPVCGDAAVDPGFSCPRLWRGSAEEQAAFVIQAYALATAAGVERTFIFQHYDDAVGDHDWYGIVRNNGTHRPAYVSYQVAVAYLSQYSSVERRSEGGIETVVFSDTARGRISVLWNSSGTPQLARLPAAGERARLADKYGTERTIIPSGGQYTVLLSPASNYDYVNSCYLLGGDPLLLIEDVVAGPSSRVRPLPEYVSSLSFVVEWERLDGGEGSVGFDVQFREGEEGSWQTWLEDTAETSAVFGPENPVAVAEGQTYYFRCRTRDEARAVEPYPADDGDAHTTVPYSIKGHVANRQGQGLAGARVEAPSTPHYATTDANGAYTLMLPPGTYQVKASQEGYGELPPKAIAAAPSIIYDFFLPHTEDWMQNGGFEDGWQGWSAGDGAYLKTFRHTGEWGAYITPTATLRQQVATAHGLSHVSFVYRAPRSAAPGELVVTVDDGSHSHVLPLTPDDKWKLGGLLVDATGLEMELSFAVRGEENTVVWLDEVSWSPLSDRVFRLNLPAVFRNP